MNKIASVKKQGGVILVISLVMLLVMTIVGVTTMKGATLQERMAGNSRMLATARANAEYALRNAEDNLDTQSFRYGSDVVNFFENNEGYYLSYTPAGLDYFELDPLNWNPAYSTNWPSSHPSVTALGGAAQPSRFFVEYIGEVDYEGVKRGVSSLNDKDKKSGAGELPLAFRITAIGFSPNQNIYTVLQSVYVTQYGNQGN